MTMAPAANPPDPHPPSAHPPSAHPLDARRWGRIPAWWLDHPGLEADGFAVLAALATFADEDGLCWPSQSTLAAKLKRSRPTINRIIQGLSDIGLVGVEHRRGRDGARLSCLYRLRFTPLDGVAERPGKPAGIPSPPALFRRPTGMTRRHTSPVRRASQEQFKFKQIPDSLAPGERACGQPHEPARTVPEDWMPTTADLAWAKARHADIDLGRHVEGFILRCQAHGYRYRDISSAWRAWLTQDAAAGKAPMVRDHAATTAFHPDARPASRPSGGAEQRLGAWSAAAAELRRRASPAPAWS
uniref:helix-turn-helix domain-containing protein n=1 Tax=Methylobacterium sp. B34 TaxID=95563 RepID=UPI0003452F40|nr:helix-turn-helix domain-containing protein [Methylobacterium sp. B34]